MQRYREGLAFILLVLLPFHALLVTVGTRVIAGPMHAPLRVLSLWKEAVMLLLLACVLIEIVVEKRYRLFRIDALDIAVVALLIVAIVVSFGLNDAGLLQFLYGVKYDLLPLLAFSILRRVPWSEQWKSLLCKALPICACVIVLYGLIALVLPQAFFTAIGYSDLHSLYLPGSPIAPFQQLMSSSLRRMQSVMSGPNQLGLWLLLPWSIVCVDILRKNISALRLITGVLIGFGIVLTFSRAAWIGAFVISMVMAWRADVFKNNSRRVLIGVVSICLCVMGMAALFPHMIIRVASSRQHLQKPIEAMQMIIAHPLGLGLGTAGPVSNMLSDTCVQLEPGDDPSWATAHPDLCVFVGGQQVQPARACRCPLLTENWYLQIGIELGIVGMVMFVWLTLLAFWRTARARTAFTDAASLSLLGVALAGLFLHAWEDSAVAYGLWIVLAAVIPHE